MRDTEYRDFYDQLRRKSYGHGERSAEAHSWFPAVQGFVERYGLYKKKCLEIGSAAGFFQNIVEDYTGTDIAESLAVHYVKPYRVSTGKGYPFDDESFDAIWSITVYEHIPHLQEALMEIKRLLKPGGVVFFAPAWQCRSWAAQGYGVRPYADFGLKGKVIKATVPVRDSIIWRMMFIVPKRLFRHLRYVIGSDCSTVHYKRLRPNYKKFWGADSDACNHIDPHDAILWFQFHGFECLSHPLHIKALLVRSGGLVFRKKQVRAG